MELKEANTRTPLRKQRAVKISGVVLVKGIVVGIVKSFECGIK